MQGTWGQGRQGAREPLLYTHAAAFFASKSGVSLLINDGGVVSAGRRLDCAADLGIESGCVECGLPVGGGGRRVRVSLRHRYADGDGGAAAVMRTI